MEFKALKIGNIQLKNNVLMAPLAGVSDIAFRHLARKFGAGLTYTEMISAKGLYYKNQKTIELARIDILEQPSAVQIFGSDALIMAEMINSDALNKFDIIDINMGCPVNKIVSNNEGSALMRDIRKAAGIISACVKATKKPVTVKFRKGFDEASINAVEFGKMCEDSGASAVTVHGRTRRQLYGGKCDFDIIAKVKQALKIPVIANGDITDRDSAIKALEYTAADGVMVARGALGRPQVFTEILYNKVDINIRELILSHIEKMLEYFDERYVIVNMRKHIAWYLKGKSDGKRIKNEVNKISDIETLVKFIKEQV